MGIIPTRMGTSGRGERTASDRGDHPHAYGDKKVGEVKQSSKTGSSPRVWGQGYLIPINSAEFRIIPTRMGTRNSKTKFLRGDGDHPHAYGDKVRGGF